MTHEQVVAALKGDYRAPHDIYRPKPLPPVSKPAEWPRKWN